ncbi:MAG: hypothetical protein FJW40_17500 [Acidobacteria bacterium]|nr:hypothetical protein [Acidobacteriota bacterium]
MRFPGNQIPRDRISRVAQNYVRLRPAELLPNRPGPRNNFFTQDGGITNPWDKWSIKADQMVGAKDQVSVLYARGERGEVPLGSGPPGMPYPFNDVRMTRWTNWSTRVNWTRTVTPRTVNSFRVMYQRESGSTFNVTTNDGRGWGKLIGIQNTAPEDSTFPGLSFTEYTGWGGNNNGFDAGRNFSIANDVSVVHGSHVTKAGFFLQRDRWDGGGQHTSNGQFSFTPFATSIPGDQSRATGNAFASFLLGYASTARMETWRNVLQKFQFMGGFIQDDWRITPRLTLNAGLRYEYTFPVTGGAEVRGAAPGFSNFDPRAPNPGAGGLPGAYVFSGKGPGRTGRSTMYPGWPYSIAPRLGFTYELRRGTVMRAAGGRSFGVLKATGGSTHFDGFIGFFSWASADQEVNTFGARLDTGIPRWPQPPDLRPDVQNGLATVDYWLEPDAGRPTQFWTWNYSLQQQVGASTVVDLGYVGTRGTHLLSGLLNVNQIPVRHLELEALGPAVLRSNINSAAGRGTGIAVPFPGFNGTVQQALQPFPQFNEIRTWHAGGERAGSSHYHALRLKVERRHSNGLSLLGSYVLSKLFSDADAGEQVRTSALDHYNRRLEKGLSTDDQTHVMRMASVWELPAGRGKRFSAGPAWLQPIVGGWSLAAFVQYQSGTPMGVGPGINPPIYPAGTSANRVTISSYDNWRAPLAGRQFDPFADRWWSTLAFQQAPRAVLDTRLGNSTRRNPKARSPWFLNENVTVAKEVRVRERVGVTIRGEAFNLFNRVRWGGPSSTYTATDFGIVRSQGNSPRQMQLALKVVF